MKTHRAIKLIVWFVSLATLAFIAYSAWFIYYIEYPRGMSRVTCMMNSRNAQQAVRAYQTEHKLTDGDPLHIDELIKAGLITDVNDCEYGGSYIILNRIPERGKLYLRCSESSHIPRGHETW